MAKPIVSATTKQALQKLATRAQQDTGTHAGSRSGAPFSRSLTGQLVTGAGDSRIADDLRAAEASHRLYVPLATDVAAGDTWTSAGRVYDVVYAPAPTAVDVDRLVGLKEIR